MAQKVELRKRNGGNFSGDNNLMLPVTHVNFVLGLLDENSNKLKTSLLPSSMLNTKRMAGSINSDTDFANLFTLIETFNDSDAPMYPGTYFISNGKRLISASTDHVIYYNDDNLNAAASVELENGDHLFYVKHGSEFIWNDTGNTVVVPSGNGIDDLQAPYNLISGLNIFATEEDFRHSNPLSSGEVGLVTGYKWEPSDFSEYGRSGLQIDEQDSFVGNHTLRDVNYLVLPTYDLWDYGQGSIGLRITQGDQLYSYWKLTKVDETFEGDPKIYESTAYTNKHIWGVVNNSYDLATKTSAGLMSAVDKVKLSSLSNYEHPTYTSRNIDTSGVEVIDTFTSDSSGHVNSISKRTLPNADTSTVGVVELATTGEGQTGTDGSRALTPASGLAMLNYNQDVSYFASLSSANSESLPEGATAIIVTGTIEI